jgi:hypothetical protein
MQTQNNQTPKTDDSSDCISASELVRRHLQDKDHEISDSDLQKVALDCGETAANNTSDVQVPDATSISMNRNAGDENEEKKDDDDKGEKDILPNSS